MPPTKARSRITPTAKPTEDTYMQSGAHRGESDRETRVVPEKRGREGGRSRGAHTHGYAGQTETISRKHASSQIAQDVREGGRERGGEKRKDEMGKKQ